MKNAYSAPEAEFLRIGTKEDILLASEDLPIPDFDEYGGEIPI